MNEHKMLFGYPFVLDVFMFFYNMFNSNHIDNDNMLTDGFIFTFQESLFQDIDLLQNHGIVSYI